MFIKISVPSMWQMFHPCEPDYIKNVCHAACGCAPKNRQTFVQLLPLEVADFFEVDKNNRLIPTESGACPFSQKDYLCGLHGTSRKPFGCIASPFALTANKVLIVQNRYRRLKCFQDEGSLPCYKAHAFSLKHLLGEQEYQRVSLLLDKGNKKEVILSKMEDAKYHDLMSVQAAKKQ